MSQVSSEMTPFEAFQARMERVLKARVHDADVELNRLHGEAIKGGHQDNSGSIKPRLDAIQHFAAAATELVLSEAKTLTDPHRAHAWHHWLEDTAERARLVLIAHVEGLYGLNLRMDARLLPGVSGMIQDSHKRMLAMVGGEVDDFARGVWQEARSPIGGTTISTNNTVNIGGNMSGGSVEQAGGHVVKGAEAPADAPMVKTYVARASNNPLANGVFLAAQALTHPARTLFFEEVSAGGDGQSPVLRVHVREEPAEPTPAAGVVAKRKPPAAPALTPTFNWAFGAVVGLVLIALGIEVYAGFLYRGLVTDATKGVLNAADWIVKGGVGAIIGLIGGKVAK